MANLLVKTEIENVSTEEIASYVWHLCANGFNTDQIKEWLCKGGRLTTRKFSSGRCVSYTYHLSEPITDEKQKEIEEKIKEKTKDQARFPGMPEV